MNRALKLPAGPLRPATSCCRAARPSSSRRFRLEGGGSVVAIRYCWVRLRVAATVAPKTRYCQVCVRYVSRGAGVDGHRLGPQGPRHEPLFRNQCLSRKYCVNTKT